MPRHVAVNETGTKAWKIGLRSPMLSSVDCKGIGANLVGCVAICGNPVCAHHDRIDLALRHQRCSRRVHDERGGQAIMHQLVRG